MIIKEFSIILNSKHEVFFSDEDISGFVILDLCEKMRIKRLDVAMRGISNAKFKNMGNYERAPKDHFTDVHWNGKEQIYRDELLLCGPAPQTDYAIQPSGRKIYEFSFKLPSTLPSSFEGIWGSIRYELKAKVCNQSEETHKVKYPLTIREIIDPNRLLYMNGFVGYAIKEIGFLGCCGGKVVLKGSIDRVCYYPGDIIMINAQVSNNTKKDIKIFKAKLLQTVQYRFRHKKLIEKNIVALNVIGKEIPKKASLTCKNELLPIPELPPTISSSEIIQVRYCLMIEIAEPRHSYQVVEIPVIIGTIPLKKVADNKVSGQSKEAGNRVADEGEDTVNEVLLSSPKPGASGISVTSPLSYSSLIKKEICAPIGIGEDDDDWCENTSK